MKKILALLILNALLLTSLYAQKSRKEIKGDHYYSIYSFSDAIKKYTKAKNLSVEGQRRLAESYKNAGNTLKAEETYAAYINLAGVIAEDYFNYAFVLKMSDKYEEANKWMQKFKELSPNDLRAKNYAANNSQLTNLLKDEGKYKVEHLDINTEQQDFGPAYYNDKITFASTREGVKSIRRNYSWNNKPFLDIYVADISAGKLNNARTLNEKLNNKMHEGPACFANEGTFMAFTRNNYEGQSKDGSIKLQIFFSEFKDGKWSEAVPFKLNNSEYSVAHPYITADGQTMYFASDMPSGFGGADLYRIKKDSTGNWGNAENLGDKINTEGNEMFPFFQENAQFLFFASNGHMGLGGLDIFLTEASDDEFGKVLNIGSPLNTHFDDFALITDDKMSKGYFSSNRVGGKGDDDIYSFEILMPLLVGKTIKGISKEKDGSIVAGAVIKIMDEQGNELATTTSDNNGSFELLIDAQQTLELVANKEKYIEAKNKINTAVEDEVIVSDLILEKDPGFSLYCLVTDKNTKAPLQDVKIKLVNTKTGSEELISTSSKGDFRKTLNDIKINDTINYKLVMEKEGYLPKDMSLKKLIDKEGMLFIHNELDITLEKMSELTAFAKSIDIKPIYFDLDKYNIRKDASIELNKIVKLMKEYPKMVIELGSHTDCRSSKAYNNKLSNNRAKASAAYIVKKGISKKRIYGKGYGESKLVNNCPCEGKEKSDCSDQEHQNNRRTEFVIVNM